MADKNSTVGSAAADPRYSLNRSTTEVRVDEVLAHEAGARSAFRPTATYAEAIVTERRVAPVNQRG